MSKVYQMVINAVMEKTYQEEVQIQHNGRTVLCMGTAPFPVIILKQSPQGGRKNPAHACKKGMWAENEATTKALREKKCTSVARRRSQDRLKGNRLRSAEDQISLGLGAKFMLRGHGKVYSEERWYVFLDIVPLLS